MPEMAIKQHKQEDLSRRDFLRTAVVVAARTIEVVAFSSPIAILLNPRDVKAQTPALNDEKGQTIASALQAEDRGVLDKYIKGGAKDINDLIIYTSYGGTLRKTQIIFTSEDQNPIYNADSTISDDKVLAELNKLSGGRGVINVGGVKSYDGKDFSGIISIHVDPLSAVEVQRLIAYNQIHFNISMDDDQRGALIDLTDKSQWQIVGEKTLKLLKEALGIRDSTPVSTQIFNVQAIANLYRFA